MKIQIEVEAETISDFHTSLTVLRKNIRKEAKRLKLDPLRDEFPAEVILDDSNCYGSFEVSIEPEIDRLQAEGKNENDKTE